MYLFFYSIFLLAFRLGIKIAAIKNGKAKQWLEGRKNIFQRLEESISKQDNIIWFHCASLGEFEQGRPVIEKIKAAYPAYKILITFFSPSGYEVRQNYELADYIFYLPVDSDNNAKHFLDIVNPSLVIFVKYEFWYYYLRNIAQRQIPFLLISSVFRQDQPFFRWYGSLYRKMLDSFTHLFVQDSQSKQLLETIGFKESVSIAGDTRFDRVTEIAEKFSPIPAIKNFCGNNKVIIAGSTWPADEKMLQGLFTSINDPSVKLIIAPHEIGKDHLEEIKKLFPSAIFYSQAGNYGDFTQLPIAIATPGTTPASPLIIDCIGILSQLYKYASITYIGGGFTRDGIHNILEAAVYGKPVLFGPNYKKYREAIELIDAGGAKSFSDDGELKQIVYTLLNDKGEYDQVCISAAEYVQQNAGATKKILDYIQENRLLTK